MTPFVEAARHAARQISDELAKGWRVAYAKRHAIGAGGDRTAEIDRLAESIYCAHLGSFGRIDSEEGGLMGEGVDTIVLDPIDGSENLLSGLPYFGSSIALQRDGKTQEAVVVNLANGDFFYKTDGPLMRGKIESDLFAPVVAREGATIGVFEKAYLYPSLAMALLQQKRKFRSPGAVALSLAYAHDLDFVIFAGHRRRYDFAAALWMCEGLKCVEEERLLIVAKEQATVDALWAMAQSPKER